MHGHLSNLLNTSAPRTWKQGLNGPGEAVVCHCSFFFNLFLIVGGVCAAILNRTYHSLAFRGFQSLLMDFVNSLDMPHRSTLTRITGEGVLNPVTLEMCGDHIS